MGRARASTGEPLLGLHGLVTHGDDAVVAQVHDALVARGERAEILGAADAGRRWSGMRFDGDVLFTQDAGVVRAAAALGALERGARGLGADIRFGHRVIALEERDDGVALTIDDGERRYDVVADTAVVTSGAWTPGILPASFPLAPAHGDRREPGALRRDFTGCPVAVVQPSRRAWVALQARPTGCPRRARA